jgi:biotin carboxylase
MSRVLLFSTTTGYQLRSFGEAAEGLGVELIFATDACHQLDDPWRDQAVPVRFHEEHASLEAILKATRERPVDGVVAVGDRPVVLAARAAAALGLPANSPAAVLASTNKKTTRERWAAAGLPVPWFFEVPAGAPPRDAVTRARFPAVVKPLGLSGSRGVIRVDSAGELEAAITRVRLLLERPDVRSLRTGLEHTLLVEGFIPGREYAVEGVLVKGALGVFAIFDKPDPLDGPFFEETIYVTPSHLGRARQEHVISAVQKAASALGLTHGPIHAECRVGSDDVFLLEIAPRPIGGLCSRVLRFSDGVRASVSLEEVLLRHALGEDITCYTREPQAAAVMMVPIPRRGILKRVEGEDRARMVRGVEDVRITAKHEQLLEPLPEAGSYLGFIFGRGSEPEDAEAAVREAHGQLRFEIAAPIEVISARPT